jgi:two-component system NtrC family sensor kinase
LSFTGRVTVQLVAVHGSMLASLSIGDTIAATPRTVIGHAVRDRKSVHIADILAAPEAEYSETVERQRQDRVPARTMLVTPLLREGVPIGVIVMRRTDVQPFTEKQIELARTFAAQAVIAIENVRLFNELQTRNRELTEALEQQTATGEILKVISGSPTDVQPVFATIVESALRLCEGLYSGVYRLEGDVVQLVAHNHVEAEAAELLRDSRFPLNRQSLVARAILDRQVVHVSDMETDPEVSEWSRGRSRALGYRSILVVPMLREGIPIGAIRVNRSVPEPFSAKEIALLRVFANQAVIAIENVRLFTELQEKNRALTEANAQVTATLEQQTATAEILRVIASSPTDVQPVFEAISRSAMRLCEAVTGAVYRFDGRLIHQSAEHGMTPEQVQASRGEYPRPADRGGTVGRAILTRAVVHVDIAEDPEYTLGAVVRAGIHRILSCPCCARAIRSARSRCLARRADPSPTPR